MSRPPQEPMLTHPMMKISKDWQPTRETVAYIRREYPKVDHLRSHQRFVTYHLGRGDKSESWDAGFRNWVGEDHDKIGEHSEGGTDYRGVPNDTRSEWDNYLMGRDA